MAFLIFPTVNDIGGTGEGNKLSESNVRDVFQRLSITGGGNKFFSGFLAPASSVDLVLAIPLGEAFMDGYHINSNSAVNVTLAASATNYVWLQYAIDAGLNVSSATIVANTSATPPARSMLICTGVTNATAITSTTDKRNFGVVKVGTEATPAWPSTWRVVDVGGATALANSSDNGVYLYLNSVYDGTNNRARITGAASYVVLAPDGSERFYTAPSVAAGAVQTFTLRCSTAIDGTFTVNGERTNIYHGRVNGDGTAIKLPSGWTSVRASAGIYDITHTLNTMNLTLSANCPANLVNGTGTATLVNVIRLKSTISSSGAAADTETHFTLMLD